MDSALAVQAEALVKSYGRRPALRGLDLQVPRGCIFGYLGPNGAGKTTTIRLLTGLLRPTSGEMTVLGLNPTRDRDRLQRRLGYLPGAFTAYPGLTVAQFLGYLGSLRGGIGQDTIEQLAGRLDLDLRPRIGTLSHGNRQKVGIVQAFMHQPDLVVLDEPTSGLDPLIQREFASMVREVRDCGQTVFLSSHILSEVEELADLVGILRDGRLVTLRTVEELRARAIRRLDLTFATRVPVEALTEVDGVTQLSVTDHTAHLAVAGSTAPLLRVAAPHDVINLVTHEADLAEVFLSYYASSPEAASP